MQTQKMQTQKIGLGAGAAAALVFAGALLLLLDPATGFTRGWVWLPYLAGGAATAVVLLTARGAGDRPKALLVRLPALGGAMVATGFALLGAAVCSMALAMDLKTGTVADILLGVLLALAALWFWVQGGAAFAPRDLSAIPTAWWVLAVVPAFGWLLIQRFMLEPAALSRAGVVVPSLSAMAALLFLAALAKVFYLPGAAGGKSLCRCGLLAFLFCTGGEGACTLLAVAGGRAAPRQLFLGLAYALLGVCGLLAASATGGEELPPEPELTPAENQGKTIKPEKL